METNPYEAPRAGEPLPEQTLVDSDPVRQLLTEIRDAQREMLEMQREAMHRQISTVRRSYWFMLVPVLIMAFPLYSMYQRMVRPPLVPPTRSRAPSPVAPTPTAPGGASLLRPGDI